MIGFLKRLFAPRPTDANRRRDPRIEPPPECALLSVDGTPYRLKNWSAQGFLASYDGNRVAGDKCLVNIQIRQAPFDFAFAAEVVIVRKESGDLAGRFLFLSPDNAAQIDAYFKFYTHMP